MNYDNFPHSEKLRGYFHSQVLLVNNEVLVNKKIRLHETHGMTTSAS